MTDAKEKSLALYVLKDRLKEARKLVDDASSEAEAAEAEWDIPGISSDAGDHVTLAVSALSLAIGAVDRANAALIVEYGLDDRKDGR